MKKRIAAPFDGKNLCDDSLRDDVFRDCYYCDDSKGRKTHVLGNVEEDNEDVYFDGIVDARWSETSNTIRIELMACPCQEDFFSMRDDFFKHYERLFKGWENDVRENGYDEDFLVEFERENNVLYVRFWWLDNEEENDNENQNENQNENENENKNEKYPDPADSVAKDDAAQDVYEAYGVHMRKAVAYINKQLEPEDVAIICAKVDKNFAQHMNPSYGIDDGKIIDLLEEYGQDNDLPEGWWEEEHDMDSIVLLIQFES